MNVMNLYEAIYIRESVRSYSMVPIEDNMRSAIEDFYKELIPLFLDIKTNIEIVSTFEKKHQISGLFSVKAPYFLVLYSENKEKYLLNGGYILEHMSLFLSSKGIGSCYLGSGHKKEPMNFGNGIQPIMVLAFGIPKEEYGRPANHANRISLKDLCIYKERPRTWITKVLEAARLAPSSMNCQPWRFVVYENRFHIFEKSSKIKLPMLSKWNEFEFGIMISHIMIVAEELWVDVDLIKLENITHKQFKDKKYVISVILKP